ncbi:MerC domain-containing protein [Erythrobacter litoralis]|uniref:MerC domain-containing protein n=1 Tax=Erythrobacter litoralis TaxID=39960 RepID=UPI00243A7A97|nr:MerC domain-containing protein [Erythrobacter litoralis]
MRARRASSWLDGIGIGISSLCVVHCLLLPLVIALSPAWSAWLNLPESIHLWILIVALPFSGTVLWRSAQNSARGRASFGIGMMGLMLMGAGLFAEREIVEVAITISGASLVAMAHLRNWRCPGRRNG